MDISGEITAWCEKDDTKGYDVSYFQTDGKEIFVEVKGISSDIKNRIRFFCFSNQKNVMTRYPDSYYTFFINNVDNATSISRFLAKNINAEYFIPASFKIDVKSNKSP